MPNDRQSSRIDLVAEVKRLAYRLAEAYAKVYFAQQCGHIPHHTSETNEAAREALHEAIDQLAAHQAEPPQGWKLVPEEPTDDMKHAANERYRTYRLATAGDLYRAMLAAAPSIPSNGGAGEAL